MKKHNPRLLTFTLFTSLLLAGCISHHQLAREGVAVSPTGRVVVAEPPPPVRNEVLTPSPGPSYVWVQGFWINHDSRWVWMPGHWEARPRLGAVWVEGHWDHTIDGWVWTPGHWE
jgi:hypothetical protein